MSANILSHKILSLRVRLIVKAIHAVLKSINTKGIFVFWPQKILKCKSFYISCQPPAQNLSVASQGPKSLSWPTKSFRNLCNFSDPPFFHFPLCFLPFWDRPPLFLSNLLHLKALTLLFSLGGNHRLHSDLFRSGHLSGATPCHPNGNHPWFPLPWMCKSLSHVRLFAIPWTVALQALLSVGISRQEYQSR